MVSQPQEIRRGNVASKYRNLIVSSPVIADYMHYSNAGRAVKRRTDRHFFRLLAIGPDPKRTHLILGLIRW
jgi:hypothetical protein